MSGKTRDVNAEEERRRTLIDFRSRHQSLKDGVLRVISEAVEHLKISLILTKMLEKPNTLIHALRGSQFEPGIKLIEDFVLRRDRILKEKRAPLVDNGMVQIIEYFQRNVEIYKQLNVYKHHMTNHNQNLLNAFEMLHKSAERHLNRNAAAHIDEERRLFKIFKESKSLNKSIDIFRQKIASFQNTMRWKIAAKTAYLEKLQNDIDEKQQEVERQIEHEEYKISRKNQSYKKSFAEKQTQLEQELSTTRNDYNNLTKENRKIMKHNLEEKNKLFLQLESVIKKYDASMKEKILESYELKDKLEEAQKELADFMIIYHKEQQTYHEIVTKREEREEREKMDKIARYMMNRAARTIQIYWRQWRKALAKRQNAKEKAKGGKKKKF